MKYILILLLFPISLLAKDCGYGIVENGYDKYAEQISQTLCNSGKFYPTAFILSVENYKNGWVAFILGDGSNCAYGYCKFENKKWKLVFTEECPNRDRTLVSNESEDKYHIPKFIRIY